MSIFLLGFLFEVVVDVVNRAVACDFPAVPGAALGDCTGRAATSCAYATRCSFVSKSVTFFIRCAISATISANRAMTSSSFPTILILPPFRSTPISLRASGVTNIRSRLVIAIFGSLAFVSALSKQLFATRSSTCNAGVDPRNLCLAAPSQSTTPTPSFSPVCLRFIQCLASASFRT